jgi:hypothetical protein
MQIFVRSVDQTFAVNVDHNASVTELKAAIEDVEFIPTGSTSFLFCSHINYNTKRTTLVIVILKIEQLILYL